ncbi:MAG: phosphoglycerate kinase [Endomicrobium sp.]|jgi:phosphoglycerate kinase|nr:phosphoglycerate kinase [Endomicrobium sp.]
MSIKKTLRNIDIRKKKVLVRVDFNVPLNKNLEITDDKRIVEAIPTIKYLLENKAAVILMSHLGRPKGKVVPKMSLEPVSIRLGELLGKFVKFIGGDCIDSKSKKIASNLKYGEVLLLENLRFHPEEEGVFFSNDSNEFAMENFAKELASMGNVFIQDAFGTIHRRHASTIYIVKHIEDSAIGLLVEKELKFFNDMLENPVRPFLAILGGAKVSDKINIIENLLNKVDSIIIGGAMAYTFLKSQGVSTGFSLVEDEKLDLAGELIRRAKEKKIDFLLPIDHTVIDKFDYSNRQIYEDTKIQITVDEAIPEKFMGVDLGPMSIEKFSEIIKFSKTIIWNGPVGVFEIDKFSKGTLKIAKNIATATDEGAISIIGGGDSVSAISRSGIDKRITHISTGGGASLKLLEGKELPGISVIPEINEIKKKC